MKRGMRGWAGRKRIVRWACAAGVLGLTAAVVLWVLLPYSSACLDDYPASTYLLDRHGHPLRVLLGPGDRRCDPIEFGAAGEWAWKALVAVEDKRFFEHPGLDPLAIGRAIAQNVSSRRVISGASTLSSQVIRMTEPRPRTLNTKLIEGFRALQMDAQFSKPAILTQYLNRAPMGGNLEGVAAASRAYFGKDPLDLDLPEAALLMGLPQSPSRFRPTRHPDRALERRHTVLRRMLICGYITPEQFRAADQTPLSLARQPLPFQAPHFCEHARSVLERAPHPATAMHRLRTTLDPTLQRLAEDTLSRQNAWRNQQGVSGGAVVIYDVATSAVRALVGSPDFFGADGQVNGATARRSPGSALKPFAYALAIDQGRYTPETVIADDPMIFKEYRPENFDRTFSGDVTLRQALVRSLNIPALRVAREIGLDSYLKTLRDLGLKTIDHNQETYGISLVLGTTEVTLLDLVTAYGALARGGNWHPYRIWEEEQPAACQRIFSEAACYLVADMLEGGSRLMDVCGHTADTHAPHVAWKTGTSSGRRDAWTVAYNPDYVIGVWIGNPSGRGAPILTGATTAAPIAYEIFRALYPEGSGPWFPRPEQVITASVCPASGRFPDRGCHRLVDDLRVRGISDPGLCEAHIAAASRSPRITSPVDGTRYRIVAGIPSAEQSISLCATVDDATPVYWFVDGKPIGQSVPGTPLPWSLKPGTHIIACAVDSAQADTVSIQVLP